MTSRPPPDPRADELLCDEALDGLDDAERRELASLLGEHLDAERDAIAAAAAAVSLAHADPSSALPPSLQTRVLADASAFFAGRESAPAAPAPAAPSAPAASAAPVAPAPAAPAAPVVPLKPRGLWLPWLIAAACLAIALVAVVTRPVAPVALTPAEARARLLTASDAVRIPWASTGDPLGKGAAGEVLWSNHEQQGYMSFRGLPANDPKAAQYQLWIFDSSQDERHPIDGGVFDVGPGGEVIVPITAKLRVQRPTLFAITLERPGGVVVSSRERLVLAAKAP